MDMELLRGLDDEFAPLETKDENDRGGDPSDVVTKALDELTKTVDERLKAVETQAADTTKIGERLDAIETKLARPNIAKGDEGDDEKEIPLDRKAFTSFVRYGAEAVPDVERKALRVADSTAGGYLAPEQFEAEILKGLVEISPIRQAARVSQTTAASVIQPKRTGRITAKWVGETETRPETEPTYGQVETAVHEMACWTDVSNQLLEDAAVNIEAELRTDFAEEFGRLEGEAFVLGNGVKKPVGLMVDPAVPVVANGHASVLQADALIKLMYALPAFYRNRGSWLMNGTSIATVRLLKDSSGRFLWQESLADGQPSTLLGRPVIEAVDMADVAANAEPIAYGDVGSAYRIWDRVGLSVLRDPFTQATNGITRFHARRRVGASVVRPEAVRKLAITA